MLWSAEKHYETIYSNSVYLVKNVEILLSDIYRMLRPGGTAVIEVKNPFLLETLDEMEKFMSAEAIAILNRWRRETMPGGLLFREWRDLVLKIGFKVEDCRNVYPDKLLIDIWNIGLRPISHLLIRMSEALSAEQRNEIKQEWVDIFYQLFKPLLSLDHTYPLEKRLTSVSF